MMLKADIRKQIKSEKSKLSKVDVKRLSSFIISNLIASKVYKEAQTIYTYVSFNQEVNTHSFIKYSLLMGKRVAIPKIIKGKMNFYYITNLDQVEQGFFGILEPTTNSIATEEKALVIMPGLAFDNNFNRIGYGKGYYDEYFLRTRENSYTKIALAYDFQIVENIIADDLDVRVNTIITPTYTIQESEVIDMKYLDEIGKRALEASTKLNTLSQLDKNNGLIAVAKALIENEELILDSNGTDIENARENGMKESLIDRLKLNSERIKAMSDGLLQLVSLTDPIGEMLSMKVRPNGLQIGERRVPLGVVCIIYESRPNVTADAFGLCFKTSNAVVLRGGSDAIHSNKAIVTVIRESLTRTGLPSDGVILIEDTSRETATELMKLNQYIDVLIPRGGSGLIKTVVENSTIPVIETGTGNCHIYVDEFADFAMALDIIDNAKTQRLGVCNTCESLVVHEKIAGAFIPLLCERLYSKDVVIRGDERAMSICSQIELATEEDYKTEYLDLIISLKVVNTIEEAIAHINKYNTKHSEAIITKDYNSSMKFINEIDSAAVYINASTRFTDGEEFGFGAEIGISTQKLHARGPMGLNALTTTKYIIFGNGQIRP